MSSEKHTAGYDEIAWREISPYLDEALDLEPAARVAWLLALEGRAPTLAKRVKELLVERDLLEEQRFLTGDPGVLLRGLSLAGQRVGAYTLDSILGHGGMGTVWLAHRSDGRFEGRVAIKLLNAALVGQPAEQRFIREGSLLARLQHPHIAHLIDAGITPGGQPYLVLEYVEGSRIDQFCEQRGLGVEARVRLFLEVLDAVIHAHRSLIVHRDLKPSNILVTEGGVVKLLDFGVAALLAPTVSGDGKSQLTCEADAALTPEYAAPEQLLEQPVTTSTDVYALGLVLFVLLVGRHPLDPEGKSRAELMRITLEREVPRPSNHAADAQRGRVLRGDLDNIIAKALKKSPADRYASAEAFVEDLRRFLKHQPVSAHADSFSYRAGKFIRRHRGSVASGAITALALVLTAGFALYQMHDARVQRDEARAQTRRAEGFNDVITTLLSQVGPGGRALSAEELLDRVTAEVQAYYADDRATLVDQLVRISGRYYDLRKTNKEYAALVAAEAAARKSGDALLLLDVQCNTVETELGLDNLPRARQRMAEAMNILKTRNDVDDGLHSDCLRAEAQLSARDHDMNAALEQLKEGTRVLEEHGRIEGNRYTGMLSLLAGFSTRAGHYVDANRYQTQMQELDRRFHREDSVAGVIGKSGMAESILDLGQLTRAKELAEQALSAFDPSTPADVLNVSASRRYAKILSRAGDHERAVALARGCVIASDRSEVGRLKISGRLTLAEALLRAGRPDEAQSPLDEASDILRKSTEPDDDLGIYRARLQPAVDLARNRLDVADRALAAELARMKYPASHADPFLPPVLLVRARLDRQLSKPGDAVRAARDAEAGFRALTNVPEQSIDVGEALLVLAQAQTDAGDRQTAQATAAHAERVLTAAAGESHALTREAARLRASL
jgi:serine/threonine-protein kinase